MKKKNQIDSLKVNIRVNKDESAISVCYCLKTFNENKEITSLNCHDSSLNSLTSLKEFLKELDVLISTNRYSQKQIIGDDNTSAHLELKFLKDLFICNIDICGSKIGNIIETFYPSLETLNENQSMQISKEDMVDFIKMVDGCLASGSATVEEQ